MPFLMLVDTDVLIWYFRGNPEARAVLDEQAGFQLSAVTYMELVQGMQSTRELRTLRAALAEWGASLVMIDAAICTRSTIYVEQHFHAHGLRLAHALIAATAVESGPALLTGNVKHYGRISDLAL